MAASARRGVDPSVGKLHWAAWHRGLGELAMDVCGAASTVAVGKPHETYALDDWQRLFLFSRADTIYAGSDEIQKNIVAERLLGLPKEARV
jgi:alkylation response protein AidB-like acyl-CoA dehydrogenase